MIKLKSGFESLNPIFESATTAEFIRNMPPVLNRVYIADMKRHNESHDVFPQSVRPVLPGEAEGYEDISELDDYVVLVDISCDRAWSIIETPPCLKEKMEKQRQQLRKLFGETCYNCGTEGHVCPCMEI